MIKNKFILTLAASLCFLGLQEVRANHIDFTQDGAFTQVGPGSQSVAGASTNILGSARFVTVAGMNASASSTAAGPLMFMSGASGGSLTLGYGTLYGGGAYTANYIIPPAGPNWNSIRVSLSSVSAGATGLVGLSVQDNTGATFTFASQALSGAGNYIFFHSAAPGINFMSITGTQLTLSGVSANATVNFVVGNGPAAGPGGITRFTAVPEPGSVALSVIGGLGLLGGILRRRRLS